MTRTPYERMLASKAQENRAKERERKQRLAKELADARRDLALLRKAKAARDMSGVLYCAIERAIMNAFPDCDPEFTRILDKYSVTMADLDKAVHKVRGMRRGGVYTWLAEMWDDATSDAVFDAKNGHVDECSPFYTVSDTGSIVKQPNPWK